MLPMLLKEEMKRRGISARIAGKEIGVAHTTILRILEGQSVDLETLVKICDWLGIQPSTILNSMSAGEGSLEASIALIIQREPRLKEVFQKAIGDLKDGQISISDLADIVHYAAYRIGRNEDHDGNSRKVPEND